MKCPRDYAPLERRLYEEDVMVDLCPSCRGMWLDAGELEKVEEARGRDHGDELARMVDLGYKAYELARAKAQRAIRCPRCDTPMEAREYARCSQVMIDACPNCHGVWLDSGEVEALELFFERSRLEAREIRRGFFRSLRSLFG